MCIALGDIDVMKALYKCKHLLYVGWWKVQNKIGLLLLFSPLSVPHKLKYDYISDYTHIKQST